MAWGVRGEVVWIERGEVGGVRWHGVGWEG